MSDDLPFTVSIGQAIWQDERKPLPAPVPSDIPAGEAGDLIERLLDDDTSMDFALWCRISRELRDEAAARLAALQQERDGWQRSAREWKELTIKHETRWEAAEALASSLQRRVEELTGALTGLVSIIKAAGLLNLSNGVQLGQTSWYVKATDALERADAALTPPKQDASDAPVV